MADNELFRVLGGLRGCLFRVCVRSVPVWVLLASPKPMILVPFWDDLRGQTIGACLASIFGGRFNPIVGSKMVQEYFQN